MDGTLVPMLPRKTAAVAVSATLCAFTGGAAAVNVISFTTSHPAIRLAT